METPKDILSCLKEGLTAEELSNTFSNALNEALDIYNAELEQKKAITNKHTDFKELIEVLQKYLNNYFADTIFVNILENQDIEKLEKSFDSIIEKISKYYNTIAAIHSTNPLDKSLLQSIAAFTETFKSLKFD